MAGAEVDIALAAGKVLFSQGSYDFFFKWELDTSLLVALETQVNSTKALLNVAEMKQMEEGSFVDKWYQNAQYLILDAEDLLGIIFTDINKEKYRLGDSPRTSDIIKGKFKYKGKDIVRTIHPFKSTREAEMREAIQKLQSIAAQVTHLGMDKNDELTTFREKRISTSSDFDPSRIVGRSENVKEIVQLLNSREGHDDSLRIIPIIGMGGVGKTTLASLVYNETDISEHSYQLKGWVCVSDKFEVTHVVKSLIESITGNSKVSDNFELLQNELKGVLQGKRFLLVLDDIWSDVEDKWETLQTIFSVGAPGSRIIVTTREEKVAYIVSDSLRSSLTLNGLSDAEGWLLFQNHAFQNGDSTIYPNLEEIGKDIVKKCRGLPLALKMLARVLLSKENDEREWTFVLHSKIWNSTSKILPSLWLSYHHLSLPLKQCFAYFSVFPKDHIFYMETMVMFWVAEGLVDKPPQSSNSSYDYEHVARTYFKHLSSNLFIQQSPIDKSAFMMHDLIHDLAVYVSKDMLVNLTDINLASRRLSFIRDQEVLLSMISIRKLNRLRTFLPGEVPLSTGCLFNNKASNDLLSNFKFLRVLSLKGYSFSVLPASIRDMKLLSYLNLACTDIEYLPQWICCLYNLQILQLSHCLSLKELPANLCDLVNLRHLILKNPNFKEMPYGIGRLTNLRTLSNYVLGKGKSKQMREFKELYNLKGKIRISGLNNIDDIEDVALANFGNKEHLEELVLEWEERDTKWDERLLDAIEPHKNLKGLSIHNYGGKRLSNWIVKVIPSVTGITSLSITSCCNCEVLPPLGNLPFLRDLNIKGLDSLRSLGMELYGDSDNPFSVLQKLKISDMEVLKLWLSPTGGRSGFASLKELHIKTCNELTEIPSCFPSLTLFVIEYCDKLGSLPSLGNSPFLKDVIINELHSLESLGEEFYGDVYNPFPALEKLIMNDMKILKSWCFLEGNRVGFSSLKDLQIKKCPELIKIPYCFPSLIELEIDSCSSLVRLDTHDHESKGSVSSLSTYGHSLRSLNISDCAKLEEVPKSFVNLLKVSIYNCENLISVPGLRHVQNLDLEKVDALLRAEAESQDCSDVKIELCIRGRSCDVTVTSLIRDTGLFTSLNGQDLGIPNSMNVKSDYDDDDNDDHALRLPSTLSDITIYGDVHTKILTQISNLNFLKELALLNCHAPNSFVDSVLPSTLKSLKLWSGPSLVTIPCQFLSGCSKNLEKLELSDCPNLACLPNVFSDLTSLQKLSLKKCPLIKLFPTSNGVLFISLTSLYISNCLMLESLPDEFHNITTLRTLSIKTCPNLMISEDGFPHMITRLVIKNCCKMDPVSNMKLSKLTSLEYLKLEGFLETSTLDGFIPSSVEILRIRGFPCLKSVSGLLPTLKWLRVSDFDDCPLLNQSKSWSTKMKGISQRLTSCARL